MAKSVTVAYILWFFLGTFGVHHFYLRRDRHAFFTWATLGGLFWIGWLRDLFYIPSYVADVNEDPEFMRKLTEKMQKRQRPEVSNSRFIGSQILGYIFGVLAYLVLWREDLNDRYLNGIAVVAHILASFGVYLVGNEGRQQVSYMWCLAGSLSALPMTIWYGWQSLFYAPIVSSIAAWKTVEWRRQPRTTGFCTRVFCLVFLGMLYASLFGGAVYYNASVTTKDGESVPLRVAMHNFFKSPAWAETKDTIKQIWAYYKHNGWKSIWQEIVSAFDPQGEANAYKVLNISESASQEEIKSAYKQLARQWHPDKVKDPEKKREAEEKFMEIQEAYDILSSLKQGRNKRNKQRPSNV